MNNQKKITSLLGASSGIGAATVDKVLKKRGHKGSNSRQEARQTQ